MYFDTISPFFFLFTQLFPSPLTLDLQMIIYDKQRTEITSKENFVGDTRETNNGHKGNEFVE